MKSGWALRRLVDPPVEPVTLDEAKKHCRVDHDDDDDEITALIKTAREWAETYTRRALVEQRWRLTLDRWPPLDCTEEALLWYERGTIELPRPPLLTVESLKYIDTNGSQQTLVEGTDYRVDTESEPARIVPVYGTTWPNLRDDINAVEVEYWAGYAPAGSPADAENVPAAIKLGIKMHVEAHYDRDPQSMKLLVDAAKNLLATYRIHTF